MTWRDDAACRDSGAEGFFPDSSDPREYDAPRAVCRRCTVRQECLADQLAWEGSIARGARHGMYGGLTPMERWQLDRDQAREERRQERRKPRHPCPHCGHPAAVQHHINRCGDLLAMHAQREAGTTIPELAETYGCTISAVRCRLNEARRRLARQAVSA